MSQQVNRRVVVTGIGVATPLGLGREAFWDALVQGASGIGEITAFDAAGFPCRVAGQVPAYRIADYVPKTYRKATKLMARDIELAVIAAALAFDDAGLASRATADAWPWEPERFGCNIGAGLISVDLGELTAAMAGAEREGTLDLAAWGRAAMNGLTPLWLLKYLPNMLACHVTIIHGLEGPSNTIACGEASGHLAIGEAFRTIQRGQADLMICGGAETKVHPMGMMRQTLLGRLARSGGEGDHGAGGERIWPFTPEAAGTVNAEGGGLLILEELAHAVRRGARIYAEVAGFGAGQDSRSPAALHEGPLRTVGYEGAVRRALADARVAPAEVSLLVPSASGVPSEDAAEKAALARLFGPRAGDVPMALPKPQLGSLAAGSSIEAAAAILSLFHSIIPPTRNSTAGRAELNLSGSARPSKLIHVLSTGWSTGGQSAALVFSRL